MKSSIHFFLIAFLLALPVLSLAQTVGNSKDVFERIKPRFPFEKGVIEYTITGEAKGQSTLTFDRNGWRSKEIRNITFARYGIESTEKRMEHKDGDQLYKVDLVNMRGSKNKENILINLLAYKEAEESRKLFYESKGGTLVGQDTILNYVCNKWEFNRGTINLLWEYKGLPLKATHKLPGFAFTQEATIVKKQVELSADFWKLPEGIAWK
ncbi:MAG: hypothetical protein JXR10_13720 [Cyclobacteriaceae bacterium]